MPYEAFEAVPHGWYLLEREDDGVSVRLIVHVYQHQKTCWEAVIRRLWQRDQSDAVGNQAYSYTQIVTAGRSLPPSAEELYDKFFYDCQTPKPSLHHLRQVCEHYLAFGDEPEYQDFGDRRLTDPYAIADEIFQKLDDDARARLIAERYNSPLAKAIYPDLRTFDGAVNDAALFEKRHGPGPNKRDRGDVIWEPWPYAPLSPGPRHDLPALWEGVLSQAPSLLGIQRCFDGRVEWTRRLIRGWYGYADWVIGNPPGTGRIRVNILLDSPDVKEEAIRFVLWHEYLHLYLREFHTRKFRDLEHKWPDCLAAEHELYTLNERFELWQW